MDFQSQRHRIIDEHRQIILDMRAMEAQISACLKKGDLSWRDLEDKRNDLYKRIEPLIEAYWKILPAVELSCCPFCHQKLFRLFDAVDLNGFWWMDRTQRPSPQPKPCDHFCFLSGALNFNGHPVSGGLFECLPGPDLPFVIPRVLEIPAVKAVISRVVMQCGYLAFPVAYFSAEKVSQEHLSQEWAQKVSQFQTNDGRRGWDIKDEVPDYTLASWIKLDKLLWYLQGALNQPNDDLSNVHFLNLQGRGRFQVVVNNQLSFR